ncbi:MAG: response regulator [Selenomonas sp.]|uniref:response regulator transcription factor n=1 Tax=Selenomonas sp. TaxID=2053611 RepID=UPI0025FD81F7|nr:response regulator [Selenomonas sp.]MCR5758659.1 response regulator [Selenomonas sp.]
MLDLVIVEDEEIIRRGLVCTIDWLRLGARVVGEAANGREALQVIRQARPDVVLTDIKMPVMDGIALTQALKDENNPAKVIFLTSYADFSYAQTALHLDVRDYLLKPVSEDDLAKALGKIARKPLPVAEREISWDEGLKAAYHTGNPYVQAVLQRIEAGFRGKLSSEAIAAELGVSSSYLSRKLKEETGQTFSGLLAQYRLQKAIEMLQAGTWRVYEVAEQTGFGEYKNFSQVFKKYLHTTPKAFMQEITVGIKL